MSDPKIVEVFDLLDNWRHLPSYQMERRADIFFALFLPAVLKEHCNRDFKSTLIPEFPLRRGTLDPQVPANIKNRSVKADYAAFTTDCQEVYLVELKTDLSSLNEDQIEYLETAKGIEVKNLLDGIICMSKKSDDHQKYVHLLHQLCDLGLIQVQDEVYEKAFPKVESGISDALDKVTNKVQPIENKAKIVYILPSRNTTKEKEKRLIEKVRNITACIITFEEFADVIESSGTLGERFAKSLRGWAKHPAGSLPPAKGP